MLLPCDCADLFQGSLKYLIRTGYIIDLRSVVQEFKSKIVLGSFSFQCSRNVKDILHGTKNDQSQVKRIVLACERDMEDFTAPQIHNTFLNELP